MDRRTTKEGIEKLEQERKEAEAKELASKNLIQVMESMEVARAKVFKEHRVGGQGIMVSMVGILGVLIVYSRSQNFIKTFPKIALAKGNYPIAAEITILFMTYLLGNQIEYYWITKFEKDEEFKAYLEVNSYFQSLKQRRTQSISLWDRLMLVLRRP